MVYSFASIMKGFAAVLLMVLFSVQAFSKWAWELDYQLNKTYIANNLCINKAKPQLHCNGKCQLAKKLAEDESNSKTSGTASLKNDGSTVFFKQDIEVPDLSLKNSHHKHQSIYSAAPCTAENPGIFHPPLV